MNTVQSTETGERRVVNQVRRVDDHDRDASPAGVVVASVFVAVRNDQGQLLLVCRRDCVGAHHRLVGLFTDPEHIVVSATGGEVRQQIVVCLYAWAVRGIPVPDLHETIDAAWFDSVAVDALPWSEGGARRLIRQADPAALSGALEPHLG